jgi:hypothetical protein
MALLIQTTRELSMYKVLDSYGTCIICWRYSTAMEWLKFCSPVAVVYNRITGKVVCQRVLLNNKGK